MPMQPLFTVNRNADYRFGRIDLQTKPKIAKAVARCVARWAEVEFQFSTLLTEMVRGNAELVFAIYASLTSAIQKAAILRTVAERSLNERDFELFSALLLISSSAEKQRNRLVHWMWGRSPKIKHGLLLADPKTLLAHGAFLTERLHKSDIGKFGYSQSLRKKSGVFEYELKLDRRKIFVVRESDVLQIYREICQVEELVRAFCAALMMDAYPDLASARAKLCERLCIEPHIARAISRIRKGNKGNKKNRKLRR